MGRGKPHIPVGSLDPALNHSRVQGANLMPTERPGGLWPQGLFLYRNI